MFDAIVCAIIFIGDILNRFQIVNEKYNATNKPFINEFARIHVEPKNINNACGDA